MDRVRILIVEDNLVVQEYLKAALRVEESFQVIGAVADGREALNTILATEPDLVLLDLFLPGMDGLDIIAEVMASSPRPIVVISGELGRSERDLPFEAQRLGAVDVLRKPGGMTPEAFAAFSRELVRAVRIMSRIKVTRRRRQHVAPAAPPAAAGHLSWELLVIGASTGGPAALHRLLSALPEHFPFSVLVAQHIIPGFSSGLADWLATTGTPVRIAHDGEVPEPGTVYLAADDRHLVLDAQGRLRQLADSSARFTPSVDLLFESVAGHFRGPVCAVVLTGMGDDGAAGVVKLRQAGALTVAEAESSAVIYGMPRAAVATGSVCRVASLDEMVSLIRNRPPGLACGRPTAPTREACNERHR